MLDDRQTPACLAMPPTPPPLRRAPEDCRRSGWLPSGSRRPPPTDSVDELRRRLLLRGVSASALRGVGRARSGRSTRPPRRRALRGVAGLWSRLLKPRDGTRCASRLRRRRSGSACSPAAADDGAGVLLPRSAAGSRAATRPDQPGRLAAPLLRVLPSGAAAASGVAAGCCWGAGPAAAAAPAAACSAPAACAAGTSSSSPTLLSLLSRPPGEAMPGDQGMAWLLGPAAADAAAAA